MPLQKSFSEQNRPAPKRPQWQRSRSNPNAQAQAQAQAAKAASRPLAPVSESTKNKLLAFQFEPPSPEAGDDPVAVAPKLRNGAGDPAKEGGNNIKKKGLAPGKTSPRRLGRPDPAVTPGPGPRLTWQDLLGVQELPKEDGAASPSERIIWRTDHGAQLPPAMSPMLARKGRKRARSSSPASSPASKSATPAIDAKKLANVLRTSRADPASELWDRFALPGTDVSPSGATNPLLAQLMVSSSPRPSRDGAAPGSTRSLRKAMSCGSHWPKRRKTVRNEEQGAASQGSPRRNAKSSLVSALLETVDGQIQRSKSAEAAAQQPKSPSSRKRSLLGRWTGPKTQNVVSPSRPTSRGELLDHRAPVLDIEANGIDDHQPAAVADSPSSDYGDIDFDDDTLMELDATLVVAEDDNQDNTLVPVPAHESAGSVTADDDFGDLDDNLFDGAEDLVAEVEFKHFSQATSQGQKHDRPQQIDRGMSKDSYGDDFGDDFGEDFDFEAAEMAATQSAVHAPTSSSRSTQKPKAIQRYKITNILESSYTDDRGRELPEKILLVQVEKTNVVKIIHLRDDWYDTQASQSAFVHVIGTFEASGRCIVDNNENMVVLHPDQLISSTVVADSFTCTRRAVLQDRVKATSELSPALVYGTILHEIFQEALLANNWDIKFLAGVIDKILDKHLEDIYIIKVGMDDARCHLLSKMPELKNWAKAFVSPQPNPDAIVQGRNGERANMCVSKLLDVEEHVWSPMYGLKGNIDATVQVTMRGSKSTKTLTVPFEVKTGKNVISNHQAQTALYNLLLSDRYDIEIVYGILYYMETSQTLRIPTVRHELRHMIMQRNQLACYVRERSVQLPPMKKSKNMCGKCYAQTSCFIYHKLADDGDGETSGLNDKFDEVVKHLTPTHKDFFLKWENLLTKEEKESQKLRRELWTMVSTEREKLGRCFSNVTIEEGSASEEQHATKINRFSYTFIKDKPAPGFSFLDSQLIVGEPIVISDEQGHFALALGFVTAVRKQRISVAVDRRLHNARIRQPGFDEVDNQVFASIMEVAPEGAKPEQSQGKIKEAPIRYRLDKDEFSNGMATVRNNLVQVMADGPFGSREIRRLVVDLVPPRFKTVPTQYLMPDKDGLNVDQKAAVEKAMSAMDYALVLGMPGTGKTTTIAHMIRALIGQGKTVLLTSYTHSAVDNILLKLKHDCIPILRLGAPAKVHPEVRDFVTLAGQPMESFEEIRRAWHDTPVVATTCLGISHQVFNERTFDYCIVDEASQITLPICLGPIRMARTFVLVGDHNQLPPLVQNEEARAGGLDVSLFKLLSDTHPQSVVNLEHQYRMCEDIMTLSNTLIYKGLLKCGTEALRSASLPIPDMDALRQRHFDAASFISYSQQRSSASSTTSPRRPKAGPPASFCPAPRLGSCWLRELLDPEARVRFVNTDAIPDSREEAKGNRIVNPCEARVVAQLVDALLAVGVPATEIGVMTHYRSQLALLKHNVLRTGGNGAADVEMHTADRFQGRDKAVVVLSLVRSNDACSIGELLKDWRRINVAFTRAKTKLLVVGSHSTLRGCAGGGDRGEGNANADADPNAGGEMLARFVALMESRDWIYDLLPTALDAHLDPASLAGSAATQLSPAKRSAAFSPARKNTRPGMAATKKSPRRAKVGERVLLKGKPVLRDILNDMMDGMF